MGLISITYKSGVWRKTGYKSVREKERERDKYYLRIEIDYFVMRKFFQVVTPVVLN